MEIDANTPYFGNTKYQSTFYLRTMGWVLVGWFLNRLHSHISRFYYFTPKRVEMGGVPSCPTYISPISLSTVHPRTNYKDGYARIGVTFQWEFVNQASAQRTRGTLSFFFS